MAQLISQKYKPEIYAGQSLIFPIIGKATFSKEGILEVPDTQVASLIEATKTSFDFIEKDTEKATVKSSKKGSKKQKEEEVDTTESELREQLATLGTKDLLEMAKEALSDPSTAAGMTDAKLRDVLLKELLKSE